MPLPDGNGFQSNTRAERFYRTDGWTELGRKEDRQIVFEKNFSDSLPQQIVPHESDAEEISTIIHSALRETP